MNRLSFVFFSDPKKEMWHCLLSSFSGRHLEKGVDDVEQDFERRSHRGRQVRVRESGDQLLDVVHELGEDLLDVRCDLSIVWIQE